MANAVFAGAEIAIVALRKSRLVELVERGQRGARAVMTLRADPERFLATVQIGITVVGVTAAAFGGASIATRLTPLLKPIPWIGEKAHDVALAGVIALISYLTIVLGELVPKSLALRSAERYALVIAKPLLWLSKLTRPLVWFLTKSSNLILRPFGDQTTFTETRHSAEELQQLVEEAAESGTLHPQAGEIASRALEFPELSAADVMVPRPSVVMLRRHSSVEEVRRVLLEHSHTRMPVYDGTPDNVVGYVHVKDLLAFAWENRLIVLEDVMRPAAFVPASQRAIDLLQDMRRRRNPFTVVIDEQGGMSGIVTMEDLLEELVGDIFSEHARPPPEMITREPDGSVLIQGDAPIREVHRELQIELPEGEWSTVAGLCMALAGHMLSPGETVTIPSGAVIEIVEATARRIRMVRLRLPSDTLVNQES